MLIKSTTSTSLVSAAVAALFLAGCGGGSDNGGAAGGPGTESGGLTTKTNHHENGAANSASTDGAANSGSTQGAQGAAGSTGGAGSTTAANGHAANDAQVAGHGSASGNGNAGSDTSQTAQTNGAITEAGISTELFEKIISTQTAYVRVGPHPLPISGDYSAGQLAAQDVAQGAVVEHGQWVETPEYPNLISYQQPANGHFVVNTWGSDRKAQGHHADAKIVTSHASFAFVFHKGQNTIDRRLTLQTDAELKYGYHRDERTGEEKYKETEKLQAASDKVIAHDGVVAFNETIQEWRASNGAYMSVSVERGDAPNEVKFCTKLSSGAQQHAGGDKAGVQRTVCSLWQVPANWTATQSLVYHGSYVMDGQNVVHYWKTWPAKTKPAQAGSSDGTATAGNAATTGTAATGAAASAAADAKTDETCQQVASSAAAADAAGNGAASVSTTDGHAATVAQQNGGSQQQAGSQQHASAQSNHDASQQHAAAKPGNETGAHAGGATSNAHHGDHGVVIQAHKQ